MNPFPKNYVLRAFFLGIALAAIQPLNVGAGLVVPLTIPKLELLETTVNAPSNPVTVHLTFVYNLNGQIVCGNGSTLDGVAATGRLKITKSKTNLLYSLTAKAATTPATQLVLSGNLADSTAKCTYTGPNGRLKTTNQVVALTISPATAEIDLSPVVSSKNTVSGTGTILAYGTNGAAAGKCSGMVSTAKLSWALKQSPRRVSFTGVRTNDVYFGTLTVSVPPDSEVVRAYSVPASLFPLVNGTATFQGTVSLVSNAAPVVGAGTQITVKSDINGDGKFTGQEIVKVKADANGHFKAVLKVLRGRPATLQISQSGFAPYQAAYPTLAPGTLVMKSVTLRALSSLSLNAGTAQSSDGKFMLAGLPDTVATIKAQVFNPKTETSQFPGEFADSQGNLLVSSVFTVIDARNSSGNSVTNLGTNAMLCLQVPRDTWSTLVDTTNGTGQIDVPLFYYDEDAGKWKRSPNDGWLEDSNHVIIPEDQFTAIRDGTYPGPVLAEGPITHLSTWNVDHPVSEHSCLQGTIVNTNGIPVESAVVVVKGLSYTGSSAALNTTADGHFCAEMMRSEGPGEDLDLNGITGEMQQVQVLVQAGSNFYTFGPFQSPLTQGTCDTGNCLGAGTLMLSAANQLTATCCTISGTLVYSGVAQGGTNSLNPGDPIEGATITAFDPDAMGLGLGCAGSNYVTTAADGTFSVTAPFFSGMTLSATRFDGNSLDQFAFYEGVTTLSACPSSPLTLTADYTAFSFLLLSLTGTGIDYGNFTLQGNNATVVIGTQGSVFYFATKSAVAQPAATGLWVTMNLNDAASRPAGTISLTVTSLSPLSGTWTTSSAGLSGTFTGF